MYWIPSPSDFVIAQQLSIHTVVNGGIPRYNRLTNFSSFLLFCVTDGRAWYNLCNKKHWKINSSTEKSKLWKKGWRFAFEFGSFGHYASAAHLTVHRKFISTHPSGFSSMCLVYIHLRHWIYWRNVFFPKKVFSDNFSLSTQVAFFECAQLFLCFLDWSPDTSRLKSSDTTEDLFPAQNYESKRLLATSNLRGRSYVYCSKESHHFIRCSSHFSGLFIDRSPIEFRCRSSKIYC